MLAVSTEQPTVVASLRGVTKSFGAVPALVGIDLEIHRGEVLALLGPNGAGKTTSVSLLLGLSRPDAGEVRLFGRDPTAADARRRSGAMLQTSRVPEAITVREHIELFSSYYPGPLSLQETVDMAGLEGLEDRHYDKLSGGQQQRFKFALAICGNPEVLFLDEPTVALDVEARRDFWKAIRGLVQRGRTVLLTTHYLEEADALADRIVVLNQGNIIASGSPADIKGLTSGRRIRCVTRLAAETVSRLPGVSGVSRHGAALEILASQAEPVVLALLQQDPSLSDLEVSGVGLEQAFLSLTRSAQKEAA